MHREEFEDTAILLIAFQRVDNRRIVEAEAARHLNGVASVYEMFVNDVNPLAWK